MGVSVKLYGSAGYIPNDHARRARYFQKKRLSLGLRLSEVALRWATAAPTGASRTAATGCTGSRRPATSTASCSQKLMAALDIDQATVNGLLQKDLEDWLRWANEPIRPYLVVRLMAAVYSQAELPDEVRSVEEAERYASEFAKERRLRVCLVLSRRVSVYFAANGSFEYASEAVPGGEPNQPYTKIGGRRCLMQFTDRGIALPEIEWFKRPQPREGD